MQQSVLSSPVDGSEEIVRITYQESQDEILEL